MNTLSWRHRKLHTNFRLGVLATILCVAYLNPWGPANALETPAPDGVSVERSAEKSPGDPEPTLRLDPVIVTARKREEPGQNVPASITTISGELVEGAGLRSVQDASFHVPNLHITEFSSRRLSFPFIRGVGSGQGDPAVVTYIDGVPQLSTNSTNIELLDVDRLEFLRGPQSTLYGRSALGGVIHVLTRRPSWTHEVDTEATAGSAGLRRIRLSYSGPVAKDRVAVRLAGLHAQRDGYTENDFTDRDVDDRSSYFGRAQALFLPNDSSEIRLVAYGERARDGGFALADLEAIRDRPHHVNQDFDGEANRDIASSSLTWSHYGESFEAASITAYQHWQIEETSDVDFSPLDLARRRTNDEQHYVSQEIRASSAPDDPVMIGESLALQWLAGVHAFYADSEESPETRLRPSGAALGRPVGTITDTGDFEELGVGTFAQITATLGRRIDFSAGLRYDYEKQRAKVRNTADLEGLGRNDETHRFTEGYHELVPRLSAVYAFSDAIRGYALAAKGFKAGGFNVAAPAGEIPFDSETSWTYEVGLKTSWREGRVTANASAFCIDWEDMQLTLIDPATLIGYVDNAGDAKSKGVELELRARPFRSFELSGSFGYADAEFEKFVNTFGVDAGGNSLPFAPETTWSVGGQYSGSLPRGIEWFAHLEYFKVGRFYYDAQNLEDESYDLTNARVGLRGEHWRIEGWVRNAFDEEYVPVALQSDPLDPSAFVGENGAPRIWGVTGRVSF